MDFFDAVKNRKAVRTYIQGKNIPDEDMAKILETVNLAPSARNLQSYKIFVVKDKKAVVKVFPVFYNQRSDFIANASVILVFCADPDTSEKVFGERGKTLYALQDATIAATYSVLTASALGYATCWVGNFRTEEMQKVLKTDLIPVASVIIGYSDDNPKRPPRKPLDLLSENI